MAVDAAYVQYVNKLRKYLRDWADRNALLDLEENTDDDLQQAIEDSIDAVNWDYAPESSYSVSQVPWPILRDRAVIEILQSNMIASARNLNSYSDPGGVNIRDDDVYGRYVNLYNILIAKSELRIQKFKLRANIESCYDGVDSEYAIDYNLDDDYWH